MQPKTEARMYVVKRDGSSAEVCYGKIRNRLLKLCYGLKTGTISVDRLCVSVLDQLRGPTKTSDVDCLAAQSAAMLADEHPDYGVLAARVEVSNLHKETGKRFSEVMSGLYDHVDPESGRHEPLVTERFIEAVRQHQEEYDSAVIHDRDFRLSYFDVRTFIENHLLKADGVLKERPQHMLMRVAIVMHPHDHHAAIEAYNGFSNTSVVHLPPRLLSAGRPRITG
jgi:ribonucleotide reductase alpha subunit